MFAEERLFIDLLKHIKEKKFTESEKALYFAAEKHKGQTRAEGVPYIIHPLTMAANAVALGLDEDQLIAVILLHDVCEDCGVGSGQLPVNEYISQAVGLMTFEQKKDETKEQAKTRYFEGILTNRDASIAKLIDRCHNVSSMAGAFSELRIRKYIKDTREYVFPFMEKVKVKYPELADQIFILSYHMYSVVRAIESVLALNEQTKK